MPANPCAGWPFGGSYTVIRPLASNVYPIGDTGRAVRSYSSPASWNRCLTRVGSSAQMSSMRLLGMNATGRPLSRPAKLASQPSSRIRAIVVPPPLSGTWINDRPRALAPWMSSATRTMLDRAAAKISSAVMPHLAGCVSSR
jgi:hypothetical protein